MESNIAWTAAAASCSPVVPGGCAPWVCTFADSVILSLAQLQPAANGAEQLVIGQVIHDDGVPDAVEEHEMADTADTFLVAGSGVEQPARSEAGQRRKAERVDCGQCAGGFDLAQSAHAAGFNGDPHAPAHGFAVQQPAIVRQRFDGMPDGVAEVEDHAQ